MKITLNEQQMAEAIRLYAMLITGLDVKSAPISYADNYNSSVSPKQAVITLAKPPAVPLPSKGVKEISQEDVDKVYSSLVNRKLDMN